MRRMLTVISNSFFAELEAFRRVTVLSYNFFMRKKGHGTDNLRVLTVKLAVIYRLNSMSYPIF